MTDIEFVMSFAAILFGLLLANVANNMADAVRSRRDLPIGFVPWAINFYISASAVWAYAFYYNAREDIDFDIVSITLLLATVMAYIVVSRLLYPEHKDRWASVEDYYISNRRLILGVMAIAPLTSILSFFYGLTQFPFLEVLFYSSTIVGLPLLIMLTLMATDKPQWHRAGWGFLVLHRIAMMIWLAVTTA